MVLPTAHLHPPLTPLPFPRQHDLIPLGIHAHGEVGRFVIFGLGFADQLAAGGDDFGGAGDDVGDLEAEAGPGAVAFAAAMDADDAAGDLDLADVRVLTEDG